MAAVRTLSPSYAAARAAFLAAASAAGARLSEYPHDLKGPDGGDLAIDVAEFGPEEAIVGVAGDVGDAWRGGFRRVGVAARVGSRSAQPIDPTTVRVVLVHALNPYGFAWVRRVNEDNVDLNRNFIDWDEPVPTNPDYVELAEAIVPASWTDEEQAAHARRTARATSTSTVSRNCRRSSAAVSTQEPNGVFYGGTGPVWSHRWLRSWFADHLADGPAGRDPRPPHRTG